MSRIIHQVALKPGADHYGAYGVVLFLALAAIGCTKGETANAAAGPATGPPVRVATGRAVEQPITRFIRASGTLKAQDDAEVAAEIAGRVIATPVERGMPVRSGADLVRIAATALLALGGFLRLGSGIGFRRRRQQDRRRHEHRCGEQKR